MQCWPHTLCPRRPGPPQDDPCGQNPGGAPVASAVDASLASIPMEADSAEDWYFSSTIFQDAALAPSSCSRLCRIPLRKVLVDLSDWDSWPFQWKSFLQLLGLQGCWEHWTECLPSGRALVPSDAPQPLLVSAARAGFFEIWVVTLRAYLLHLGIHIENTCRS